MSNTTYAAPKPVGIFSRIKDGITVYKGEDGLRYMFIVTSNSYQDRDNETITTKALQEYVDSAWAVEDKCLPRNELQFWHDGDPIGDVVWTDTEGPFLLEVAKERRNKAIRLTTKGTIWETDIKSVWDACEKSKYRWGASHGFRYPDEAYDKGVFKRISKFETSLLPLDAASNPYTFSGVINEVNKDKVLEDLLKTPGLADKFRKGIRSVKQSLDERGLEHKAADDEIMKGHLQDAQSVLDKAFAKIGGTVPDGFSQDVLHQLINVMGDGEPDGDEAATSGAPAYDNSSMSGKQVKLFERLITSQEAIVENDEANKEVQAEIATALKAVAESVTPLRDLPEAIKALDSRVSAVEPLAARLKALEDRLNNGPRRAQASAAPETVVDDKVLTEKAKELTDHYEDLFPGSGIKIKPASNGAK